MIFARLMSSHIRAIMGYIHFIHEMQTQQGKQRSRLHSQFYYLWPTKKRCGLTFLHWKGKKKKCTGKLSKTSNVIISSFPLFFSRMHGNFGLN